jgi:hypothetical protein
MDFRPAFAVLLFMSGSTLHAQPSIGQTLNKCLVGVSPASQPAIRNCIGPDWASSLQSRDQALQQCTGTRTSLERDLVNQRNINAAQAKETEARVAAARAEERERIRTRRFAGIEAVKLFLYELDANSRALDRELELNTDPGLAGTVVVKRKRGSVAVLLPFPSLAKEELVRDKEDRYYLFLQCRPDSGNCITNIANDGGLKSEASTAFLISPAQSEVLLGAARNARLAFTD